MIENPSDPVKRSRARVALLALAVYFAVHSGRTRGALGSHSGRPRGATRTSAIPAAPPPSLPRLRYPCRAHNNAHNNEKQTATKP
jgi:hypothetical protein